MTDGADTTEWPSERLVREVLQILARAHRKLDARGVPPAPRRPIISDEAH